MPLLRRARRAYRLLCAREDARLRGITTPDGVYACDPCRGVFFTHLAYLVHDH